MRGWAAHGSLGTAALLGVSGARNPLPTGSPSWASRTGRTKAFCALGPAMPPEPARPLSAEVPSQRRPKTSFWELPSQKGNSPPESKLSPSACLLSKAALAGFAPRPVLALRPRRVWAASRSLCAGAWPRVTGAGNHLQTCCPSGRWWTGPEKALCALTPAFKPSPAREERTWRPSQNGHKTSFWELHS